MNCPKCASADIRRSQQETWGDMLYALRGRRAFRCRSCRCRFHLRAAADGPAASGTKWKPFQQFRHFRRRLRPWMVEMAIFAVLLLIFFAFLRYLTREPAASPEGRRTAPPYQLVGLG
jgi:hypothetical protein